MSESELDRWNVRSWSFKMTWQEVQKFRFLHDQTWPSEYEGGHLHFMIGNWIDGDEHHDTPSQDPEELIRCLRMSVDPNRDWLGEGLSNEREDLE